MCKRNVLSDRPDGISSSRSAMITVIFCTVLSMIGVCVFTTLHIKQDYRQIDTVVVVKNTKNTPMIISKGKTVYELSCIGWCLFTVVDNSNCYVEVSEPVYMNATIGSHLMVYSSYEPIERGNGGNGSEGDNGDGSGGYNSDGSESIVGGKVARDDISTARNSIQSYVSAAIDCYMTDPTHMIYLYVAVSFGVSLLVSVGVFVKIYAM